MKKVVIAAVIMVAAAPALAQAPRSARPATPAPAGGRCAALQSDWRNVEITLAQNSAEGIGDNSAPRATMRAMDDNNALIRAQITLELMRAAGCTLPARPPLTGTFLMDALDCQTELLRGGHAGQGACDTASWPRARAATPATTPAQP
jgi:hypothetical protein